MYDTTDNMVCSKCRNCVNKVPFKGELPFCILHGKQLEIHLWSILGCEDWRKIPDENSTFLGEIYYERN